MSTRRIVKARSKSIYATLQRVSGRQNAGSARNNSVTTPEPLTPDPCLPRGGQRHPPKQRHPSRFCPFPNMVLMFTKNVTMGMKKWYQLTGHQMAIQLEGFANLQYAKALSLSLLHERGASGRRILEEGRYLSLICLGTFMPTYKYPANKNG